MHPINPGQPSGQNLSKAPANDKIQAQLTTAEKLLTPLERVFLAGLLNHLPAACAFTLPIRASYTRMLDGIWSGGTWVAWGRDNREAPVRFCVPPAPAESEPTSLSATPNTPSKNHFEIKCIDGTSSPYLVLASLLGSGLLGIQSQALLVEQDCAVPAAEMTEAEREAVGVRRRMPRTWEEARAALEGDQALRSVLGGVVEGFLSVGKVSHLFATFAYISCLVSSDVLCSRMLINLIDLGWASTIPGERGGESADAC